MNKNVTVEVVGKTLIIPEQLEMLKLLVREGENISLRKSDVIIDGSVGDTCVCDKFENDSINRAEKRAKESGDILNNYQVINTYSSDVIGIGTKFDVLFIEGKEQYEETFVLIQKRVANEPISYLSCEGPGIQFMGKVVGSVLPTQLGEARITKIYASRLVEEEPEKKFIRM